MKSKTQQIHYDVGQVDVQVNHSHQNKLKVLKMTMENWQYNDGSKLPLDSKDGRLFEADLHLVNELVDVTVHLPKDAVFFLPIIPPFVLAIEYPYTDTH